MKDSRGYDKARYDRVRRMINDIKVGRGCADCGNRDVRVLDFDHVRGVKLFNIGTSSNRGVNRVLEEIEKCDVVCSNCHRIRTWERRNA